VTSSLSTLFLFLLTGYFISLGGLHLLGLYPPIPWIFIVYVLLLMPFAFVLSELGRLNIAFLPKHLLFRVLGGFLLGVVLVNTHRQPQIWVSLGLVLSLLQFRQWPLSGIKLFVISATTLVVGEALVWNLNYLLGFFVSHRLYDSLLLEIDRILYSWVFTQDLAVEGMFPLVRNVKAVALLENAYLMLFPEILLLLFLTARESSARVCDYLLRLFITYFIAMLSFAIVPAVGPPIFMPTTMSEAFRETLTFALMQQLTDEYNRLQAGLPQSGFGYFIALPSLHVSIATLGQILLKPYPTLFWTFFPINVLLILSTVLLGWHYFLDLPTGLLLPVLVDRVLRVWPVISKKIKFVFRLEGNCSPPLKD